MASCGNEGPSREAGDGGGQAADPVAEKWRVCPELRDLFKRKLTIALTDVEELKNNGHIDRIDLFARKLESKLYRAANSRYEYYSFMAEIIYKYHLESEELQPEMEENQPKKFEDDQKEENEEAQQQEFEVVEQQPEAQEPQPEVEILRPKDPFLEVEILRPNNSLLDFKILLLSLTVGIIYQIITML